MTRPNGRNMPAPDSVAKSLNGDEPCYGFGTDGAIHEIGFDLAKQIAHSAKSNDLMVPGQLGRWISPYSWSWMATKTYSKYVLTTVACASSASGAAGCVDAPLAMTQPQEQPAIQISGRFLAQGGAEFRTFYQFGSTGPFTLSDADAEYCLELQTASGSPLLRHCFAPQKVTEYGGAAETSEFFSLLLPFPSLTRRVVLRRGQALLAQRSASAHPPTVAVAAPAPGAPITDAVTISWVGHDDDGDALRYSVLYSADGGSSWWPMGVDLERNSLEVPVATLAGSSAAQVRVLASDGFWTAPAFSAPFAVPRKQPNVHIYTPEGQTLLHPGEAIFLRAHAEDLEDGQLDGDRLIWRSDRQGVIARGSEWVLPAGWLEPGQHVITLTATDGDGMTAEASVTIFVGQGVYLPVVLRML